MPHKKQAMQVLLAEPMGKRPRGRQSPRWSDYIGNLAKSRLGVGPAELSEIVVDHEVFQVLLGLLHPRTFLDEKRHENQ